LQEVKSYFITNEKVQIFLHNKQEHIYNVLVTDCNFSFHSE